MKSKVHQPDQLMQKESPKAAGLTSSTGRLGQILTGTGKFVPTGLDAASIDRNELACDWITAMKRAVRSAEQLRRIVELPAADSLPSDKFPTFAPWEYIARIQPGDPADPLLLQVLPRAEEHDEVAGFTPDPVGDLPALAAGGLIHKYAGRALLIATGACGVHCRYCFRREFPYSDVGSQTTNWEPAIRYLQQDTSVDEVILSGGDPLTLVDQKISDLIDQIEQIKHIRRLRIHSRMPIVIPQRVTTELVDRLTSSRLTVWMVIHSNHPNELDQSVLDRLAMLINAGIPILNQAVLLRGVNDNAETMAHLCRLLVDQRVQPYYLNQLDRVIGAAHFEVPIERGLEIMDQLRAELPGYAVPTYVTEQPGEPSKKPISN